MTTKTRTQSDAEKFLAELHDWRKTVLPRPYFRDAIASGKATRNGLRTWAKEMFHAAYHFPRHIAAVLAHCQDEASFHNFSANFSREAGWYETPYHPHLLFPFGEALGFKKEEFYSYEASAQELGWSYAVYYFAHSSLEEGIGAIAISVEGVGSTLVTGDLSTGLVRGSPKTTGDYLKDLYGFDDKATIFWYHHRQLQVKDVGEGLELVEPFVKSKEQREKMARAFRHVTILMAERDRFWADMVLKP